MEKLKLPNGYWMEFKPEYRTMDPKEGWAAHWNLFRPDGRYVGELEEPEARAFVEAMALTAEVPAPSTGIPAAEQNQQVTSSAEIPLYCPIQNDEACAAYIMKQWGLSVAPQEMVEILRRHRTQAATGWLPISQAPKDGTNVLLWAYEVGGPENFKVFKGQYNKCYGGFADESIRQYREWCEYPWFEDINDLHATHYMPLPAAPAGEGDK